MIRAALAGALFASAFLLLALGRFGKVPLPRGATALAAGAATALLLGLSLRHVDWDVVALLAGLMALAGLCGAAGLFGPVERALGRLAPARALTAAAWTVAGASALLLNDAAVVVLLPVLLPPLRRLGLAPVPVVVLLALAANFGSLLTPFGNPQNAALAAAAGLGVPEFLRQQGPLAALGFLLLALAAHRVPVVPPVASPVAAPPSAASATPLPPRAGRPHAAPPRLHRALAAAGVVLFVALAAWPGRTVPLGLAAVTAAALLYAGLRPLLGAAADRAVRTTLDLNVLALFVGLYWLTAGLRAWAPLDAVRLSEVPFPVGAALLVALGSNVFGNVPTVLVLLELDGPWSVAHAPFLVAASTLGGALLLTGSAASLIAADLARRQGVEVGFSAFARRAVPWGLPLFVAAVLWHA